MSGHYATSWPRPRVFWTGSSIAPNAWILAARGVRLGRYLNFMRVPAVDSVILKTGPVYPIREYPRLYRGMPYG